MILAINWTVDSEIIDGWRTPNLYGLLFVTGLILGYFVVKRMFKQEQISDELLDKLVWFMIPATVIGARLGHVFFYGPLFDDVQNGVIVDRGYLSHPADIFKIWEGGLASHGAAIVILLSLWYYSQKDARPNFRTSCDWSDVYPPGEFSQSRNGWRSNKCSMGIQISKLLERPIAHVRSNTKTSSSTLRSDLLPPCFFHPPIPLLEKRKVQATRIHFRFLLNHDFWIPILY